MIKTVSVIIVLMGAPSASDIDVEVHAQPVTIENTLAECQADADRLNWLSNSWLGFMLANSYWFCVER